MNPDLSTLPTCSERWEEMTVLPDRRRLCARCRHPVVDFRGMTKEEITLVLAVSDERVCGLYAPEHVRPVVANSPRRGAGLVTLALGASLLASRAQAQVSANPPHEQTQFAAPPNASNEHPPAADSPIPSAAAMDTLVIEGRVRAEGGAPLASATVVVDGRPRAVTDVMGNFIARIPAEPNRDHEVRIARIGYAVWTRRVSGTNGRVEVDAVLGSSVMGLVGYVVETDPVARRKRTEGFSVARIDVSGR